MDVLNITKITLCWELFQQQVPQLHIARELQIDRVTVYRWIQGIQTAGDLELFLDHYLNAKKGTRRKQKVDGLLKSRIYSLRDKYDCCGQKIRYFLDEEYGVDLGVTRIYEILKEKYKLRSKWKKNQKRGYTPKATKPQEVVQMDTVDFGETSMPLQVLISSVKKQMYIWLRNSLLPMDMFFSNRQWKEGSIILQRLFRQMEGMNLRVSFKDMFLNTPIDIGLLIPTERMSSHI